VGNWKPHRRDSRIGPGAVGGLCLGVLPASVPRVVIADPDDDHVIAAAVAAQAEIIVSGDRHLLELGNYQNIRILNAAEAINRF